MIKQARFIVSVANASEIKDFGAPEIAIAGKSNVGKSSFINFLVNQSKLAKTSSEPGRTRLLNYFEINNGEYYFVDLPGYGYAKAPKGEKEKWGALIENYFRTSKNLINVFVLVDIRHEPSADDKMLINYLYSYHIPFTVIATKADKLSRAQQQKAIGVISSALAIGRSDLLVTSAEKKTGKEAVIERIDNLLKYADSLKSDAQNDDEEG